jgi:soluble cytochrome b562
MYNSDFYKLKYLKYKNKYISLKNKNELELKGGFAPVSGIFLFFIPKTVLDANGIRFGGINSPQRVMYIDKLPLSYLTFEHLYNMSVLVIPVESDETTISSTKEWFIPQKTGKFNPKKWGEEKKYDVKDKRYNVYDERKWLYYIAKQFLDANPSLKLPNLDDLDVSCLEYDINKVFSNKMKTRVALSSFNSFHQEVQKNQKLMIANKGTYQGLETAQTNGWDQIKLLKAQISLVEQESNEALIKSRAGTEQEKTAAIKKYNDLQKEINTKKEEIKTKEKDIESFREAYDFLAKNLKILGNNKDLLQWTQVAL